MTIEEVKQIIEPYIDKPIIDFIVEKQIFSEDNGRKIFNKTIREKVDKKFGIYVWVNNSTNEIIYIGMAGRIKKDGKLGKHSIQNRLLASRRKDKTNKKYIQTNDYVCDFMKKNIVEAMIFYIMYSKTEEPPAYLEALLLYNYFKKNNRLPELNYSF